MKITNRIASFAAVLALAAFPAVAGNSGTSLTVTLDAPTVTCNAQGNGATVSIDYTVLSTGSADSAEMTVSVNGVISALPTIKSGSITDGGGWTMGGRTKTAEGTFTTELPNGTYNVFVCANQSTNPGRISKMACSATAAVVVNCTSPSACANVGPFGEVPANKNLCAGNGNGNIQIQFRGDFGPVAMLLVQGPGGFAMNVPVERAGDSCNYHYNWDPADGQQPGIYTFSVGSDLTWTATLECDQPGRN
jgi:hypothetical protein